MTQEEEKLLEISSDLIERYNVHKLLTKEDYLVQLESQLDEVSKDWKSLQINKYIHFKKICLQFLFDEDYEF